MLRDVRPVCSDTRVGLYGYIHVMRVHLRRVGKLSGRCTPTPVGNRGRLGSGHLLVGVVPSVNLEWIQKIHRDNAERGYSADVIVDTILRRMHDYVHYITPQFSRTDINFQRVATVDTSNPFIARDIPTPDESFIVIRFQDPKKFDIDFPYLLTMLHDSFMSRRNTIVVPAGKMGFAMEIILAPIIQRMLENRTD